MAEEDQDQKTEQPTGKRLDEAREKGQLPISRETAAWVVFVGILITVAWIGPGMARRMAETLQVFLEMPHAFRVEDHGFQVIAFQTIGRIGLATGLAFAILTGAALLGTMAQTGFFASLEILKPDIGRLSPLNGFRRLFSVTALVELGKSFGKMVILGIVVFFTLLPIVYKIPSFAGHSLIDVMNFLHDEAVHLIIVLLLVFTAIALADLFYQRFRYFKNLRMTKAEVKDEYKQQEGDPMIKARLRQIRLEKARKRMMAQVPKADVVVTNPTHYAIALQYDNKKMAAPIVVAKGMNKIAERIRNVAEEHKVPLVSNPPLARGLYDNVELDQAIPTQYYRAVAEVISYVYKLKKKIF
ncbi:MAG: flagellar biosynthesis protein FlhB [Alphaproteobacteria bacterium]|nr:flagellar biosynthesis protein FlhB [Alphaproteobacteria bacterium]